MKRFGIGESVRADLKSKKPMRCYGIHPSAEATRSNFANLLDSMRIVPGSVHSIQDVCEPVTKWTACGDEVLVGYRRIVEVGCSMSLGSYTLNAVLHIPECAQSEEFVEECIARLKK